MTNGQHAVQPVEQPMENVKEEATRRQTQAASDELPEEEPAHHANEQDPNMLLASPEFKRNLDVVCQSVFREFGPSEKYPQWEDLRQETLLKFVPWLEKNEVEATLKSILNEIVRNLCIDEERRRKALKRAHVEINLDQIDIETLRNPTAEDADLRVFFKECRSRFSGRKRIIFDGYFIGGWSLTEIAKRHGFSPQTAVNLIGEILDELRHLVSGRDD